MPPLLGRTSYECVQAGARLTKRGVAVPRRPVLPRPPRAHDHALMRLVHRAEELTGHPALPALGRAQPLVHRSVPLAFGGWLQLHVRDNWHPMLGPLPA